MLRITFCWTHLSGYAASCFRALSEIPDTEVTVLAFPSDTSAPFDVGRLGSIPARILTATERLDSKAVRDAAFAGDPQVLVISGWAHPAYRKLLNPARQRGTRLVLAADTPIRFNWRQRLARLRISWYIKHFDAVVVPGERGYQAFRYWGVSGDRIWRGLYGIDYNSLSKLSSSRGQRPGNWPRRFLFTGRVVASKGIPILMEAYRNYRQLVADPWPLSIVGTGPLLRVTKAVDGVECAGFVQPAELGEWLGRGGVFVLPSLDDPWPLALVEAAASGLPVIASDACGSAVEIVRDFHSGLMVPSGSVPRLTAALLWCHHNVARLAAMGANASMLASAYSAQAWAERFSAIGRLLMKA